MARKLKITDKRERTRCAQVALYHLYVVVLGKELNVKRTRYVESLGYLLTHLLYAANSFDIKFLRRELDCGIARMHAGKLDVLRYGIDLYLTVLGHGIHLYFLGKLNELGDNDRMLL